MNINEIKELILWCKSNKVKSLSHDGVAFELSDIAFIEDMNLSPQAPTQALSDKVRSYETSETFAETEEMSAEEEEDLLFWSAKK